MKNSMMKSLAVAALTLGMVATSHATYISGEIDMSGTATLNSTLLGSATAATGFSGVTVGGVPTGSFVGTGGSSVTWSAFSWPSSTAVNPLWTFTVGATTYQFDLSSVSIKSQDNTFLNLLGVGTLTETGYQDTPGTWSFTISNPDGGAHANFAFTFANSQTAAGVPDGGLTVALLGGALSCLALVRRKLA